MPILRRRENVWCPALPPVLEFVSETNTRLNSDFPKDLFAGNFICSAEYLQADSTQIPSSKDNVAAPGRRRARDTGLARLIEETSHRPWPVPQSPWVLYMCWENLLFLHWPVRLELIRPLIPPEIEIETFDGSCWIGVVPFRMTAVRPRFFPGSFDFPELNVRTYVRKGSKSGVWFFSLDAASWLSVRGARWLGMPYYDARMAMELKGDRVNYRSLRTHNNAPPAEFSAMYRPIGEAYHPTPGTLDHWLTERYCLYAAKESRRVVFGEIHHPPWPLQTAEVEIQANTMAAASGIELPDMKPLAHFARSQEVIAWRIVTLARCSEPKPPSVSSIDRS